MRTVFDKLLMLLNEREQDVPAFAARIAPVYTALDWKWYISNSVGQKVPDKYRIMEVAYDLIRNLRKTLLKKAQQKKPFQRFDRWFWSTAGLIVEAIHYENGECEVNLRMEIEA